MDTFLKFLILKIQQTQGCHYFIFASQYAVLYIHLFVCFGRPEYQNTNVFKRTVTIDNMNLVGCCFFTFTWKNLFLSLSSFAHKQKRFLYLPHVWWDIINFFLWFYLSICVAEYINCNRNWSVSLCFSLKYVWKKNQ